MCPAIIGDDDDVKKEYSACTLPTFTTIPNTGAPFSDTAPNLTSSVYDSATVSCFETVYVPLLFDVGTIVVIVPDGDPVRVTVKVSAIDADLKFPYWSLADIKKFIYSPLVYYSLTKLIVLYIATVGEPGFTVISYGD